MGVEYNFQLFPAVVMGIKLLYKQCVYVYAHNWNYDKKNFVKVFAGNTLITGFRTRENLESTVFISV